MGEASSSAGAERWVSSYVAMIGGERSFTSPVTGRLRISFDDDNMLCLLLLFCFVLYVFDLHRRSMLFVCTCTVPVAWDGRDLRAPLPHASGRNTAEQPPWHFSVSRTTNAADDDG